MTLDRPSLAWSTAEKLKQELDLPSSEIESMHFASMSSRKPALGTKLPRVSILRIWMFLGLLLVTQPVSGTLKQRNRIE